MLKRLEALFISSVLVLGTALVLIFYTMQREQEFKEHNNDIQKVIVKSAAYAINHQLMNKRRHVELFLEEYDQLFTHIDRFPEDENTLSNINYRLQQRFTDFFTFTITDDTGDPVLLDIESLVGEACQRDLQNYSGKIRRHSKTVYNEIFVHPQPYHYHYDVMAPLKSPGVRSGSRIFFASFYLDEIADILKRHEVPGQQLLLVRQSVPDIIEVSRQGARDKLERPAELSYEEKSRILVFENIPMTDWRVINLPDENFEKDYVSRLWTEVIVMLSILTIGLFVMIRVMFKYCERGQSD